MERHTALPGLLQQRDRRMMLYRLAFDFVDPEEGLQSIRDSAVAGRQGAAAGRPLRLSARA